LDYLKIGLQQNYPNKSIVKMALSNQVGLVTEEWLIVLEKVHVGLEDTCVSMEWE